jgi:Amt family ammonium transporter
MAIRSRKRPHAPWIAAVAAAMLVLLLPSAAATAFAQAAPGVAEPAASASPAGVASTADLATRVADLEAYVTNSTPKALVSPGPGHNAWMMTSSALVLFMTLPGLALFYGGLVRSRGWS